MKTRSARSDLVAQVLGERATSRDAGVIGRRQMEGPGPLVAAQRRLWILHQLDPESSGSNRPLGLTLTGPLDQSALTETLTELVRRHEALRTVFPSVDGEPVQVVQPPAAVPLQLIDLQDSPPGERTRQADQIAVSEAARPIDLSRGPAVRAVLLRLGPERHVLLLLMHHIVFDGWSQGVLQRELAALYQAFSAGRPSPLPELPIQPVDYAVWEQAELADGRLDRHLRYWRERLEPLPPPLVLPGDFPEPAGLLASQGIPVRFLLPSVLSSRVREWSRRERATPFMTLLSAFQVLLGRYAGRSEFLMAVPVAGRTRPEIEGLVGCFMNLMLIRADLSGEQSFRDLVGRTRDQVLASFGHQEIPFERLTEELQPIRRPNRWPLFDVLFNLRNLPGPGPTPEGHLRIEPYSLPTRNVEGLALSLEVQDLAEGFECSVAYATNLFLPETVRRLCDDFVALLDGAVEHPDRPVTFLPFVSGAEGRPLESPETPHVPPSSGTDERPETNRSGVLEDVQAGPPPAAPEDTEIYVLPTSFAQRRLWLLDQMEPNNPSYNIPQVFELRGPLDVEALQQSFQALVDRHETLRTTIEAVDGMPVQRIAQRRTVAMELTDLTGRPTPERRADAGHIADQEASIPFDLARGPLFRVRLLRLGPEEHVLILVLHHIVGDGWSVGVLFSELSTLYRGFRAGQRPALPELPVQYADYAIWQEEWLRGEVLARELTYWRERLAGAPALLQLPTDRPRPPVQSHRGARRRLELPLELAGRLRELSRAEGATLYMTLLGAFAVLLQRYSGQRDLVIGSPIAGRTRTELEGLIGFFVNTLALRLDLSGAPSFRTLLGRVRETALGAYTHQELPFERLVEELQPARTLQHNPIVQVLFQLWRADRARFQVQGIEAIEFAPEQSASKFDLSLTMVEQDDCLGGACTFNTDLFDPETIACLLRQFTTLLERIAADPDAPIDTYSLVTDDGLLPDPAQPLPRPPYPALLDSFAARVRAAPERTAIEAAGRGWTYRELADSAEKLAEQLASLGVGPGDVVAIRGATSFGLIASLLGVLSCRGVILPIDSHTPTQRQQLMLDQSGARHLLLVETPAPSGGELLQRDTVRVHHVDPTSGRLRWSAVSEALEATPTRRPPDPEDPAYVFFTSGTTGIPKAVLGVHRSLDHFLAWQRSTFGIGPDDRCPQLVNLSFDPVLRDVFLPLTSGATLCLPPADLQVHQVASWLARERITLVHVVPSLAQAWIDALATDERIEPLRWVFLAGEPLTDTLARRLRQATSEQCGIVNLYGPTEATMVKCFHLLPPEPSPGIQPIGRALPQTQALVLADNGRLCGVGEVGEVVLRTPYLTRGYLNVPEENQRRFIPNPFRADPDDLVYRTGDLGRFRWDGSLVWLGRRDQQLKILGVRIEPGEVAAQLMLHPAVRSCAVFGHPEGPTPDRLVAYVVADGKVTPAALRAHLAERLPPVMVPSGYVFLPELPLGANGKLDRRAVPVPEAARPPEETSEEPRSPIEEAVASIWCEVLRVDHVPIHADFFALGGHSLRATQVLARVQTALGVTLPARTMFETPTVAGLAAAIVQRLTPDRQPPTRR